MYYTQTATLTEIASLSKELKQLEPLVTEIDHYRIVRAEHLYEYIHPHNDRPLQYIHPRNDLPLQYIHPHND